MFNIAVDAHFSSSLLYARIQNQTFYYKYLLNALHIRTSYLLNTLYSYLPKTMCFILPFTPYVTRRKNWLFADTTRGARASAIVYSMIESAKANQLNPYMYLVYLLAKLPGLKELKQESLAPFLPCSPELPSWCRNNLFDAYVQTDLIPNLIIITNVKSFSCNLLKAKFEVISQIYIFTINITSLLSTRKKCLICVSNDSIGKLFIFNSFNILNRFVSF